MLDITGLVGCVANTFRVLINLIGGNQKHEKLRTVTKLIFIRFVAQLSDGSMRYFHGSKVLILT